MSDDPPPPPLDELLSHRPLGRVLQVGEVHAEFMLIRRAWEATGNPVPGPEDFATVGRGSGTHLLKLAAPRAPVNQSVLRIPRAGSNSQPYLVASIDAKKAKVAKIVFRLLEITGHPPRHLVDHILSPDDVSSVVTAAFADAFGQDVLEALRAALEAPPTAVTSLPVAEFPVIFLPRPGGGDLQATPLAPAEAYVRFGEVTAPYRQRAPDRPASPRGRWHRQHVSDKPQNISGAVGKRRTRFRATMPRVLGQWEAELHRYAQGGPFPLWRDAAVIDALTAYADRLDRRADYSNSSIRTGLDRRADSLIGAARDFITETFADARECDPEAQLPDPPMVADVILRRRWPRDGFDRARWALTSDHFRARLRESRNHV